EVVVAGGGAWARSIVTSGATATTSGGLKSGGGGGGGRSSFATSVVTTALTLPRSNSMVLLAKPAARAQIAATWNTITKMMPGNRFFFNAFPCLGRRSCRVVIVFDRP